MSEKPKEEDVSESYLLKHYGERGLIVMAVIVGLSLIIICLSKANDWSKQRLPFLWHGRIQSSMKAIEEAIKKAKEFKAGAEQAAIVEGCQTGIRQLKNLVGPDSLIRISSLKIDEVEKDLEVMMTDCTKQIEQDKKDLKKFAAAKASYISKTKLKEMETPKKAPPESIKTSTVQSSGVPSSGFQIRSELKPLVLKPKS
jgi:hypothetical protein